MDDKTWITGLSQARVAAELARQRFDVFTETAGKAPFDLVAHRDGKLYRVSVKSTMSPVNSKGSWEVQLKRVRPNKSANVIHRFDNTSCDILAVYIETIDTVRFINPADIDCTSSIKLRISPTPMGRNRWLIDSLRTVDF